MRRHFRNVAVLVTALGIGSVVSLASGADAKVEAEVKKLQGDAMDVDFLSLDLKAAEKKLNDAIKKCGADKCSGPVLASVYRDLGVVQINNKNAKGGQASFDKAFAADPNVTIPKDYLGVADVQKAWDAAKGKAGPGTAPTPTATATTAPTTPKPAGGGNAEGNLEVGVTVAPTGYELPIVIELPEGLDVDGIKLSYKTAAMDKYKTVDAKKDAGKFVVIIPCEDTQFVGEIKFYVRAYDAEKTEVERYGTLKKPAVLKLVDKMPDDQEAPSLPGGKDPQKCVDKGDCQPGFPCDKSGNKKPQGSGCEADDECETGLNCVDNEQGKKWCYDTGGASGKDPKKGGKTPTFFLGLDLQQDFLLIGKEENICKQQTWACTKGGTDVGVKDEIGIQVAEGGGGNTAGGFAFATTRVLVSGDYFVMPNLSIGLRLGYAFLGGNPTVNAKFLPFHAEARLQYFFSDNKGSGLRPYAMIAGGLAEFDAKVPSIVTVPNDGTKADDPSQCPGNCRVSGVDAYRLAGQSFIAPGGGVWFMFSQTFALNVGLKILLPLPTFSPGLALELGPKISF